MSDVPAHSDQPSAQLHTWDFRGCLDRIDTQKPFASSVALLNRGLWRIRKQGRRSSSARRWWSCGKECCGRRSSHSRRSRDSNSIWSPTCSVASLVLWNESLRIHELRSHKRLGDLCSTSKLPILLVLHTLHEELVVLWCHSGNQGGIVHIINMNISTCGIDNPTVPEYYWGKSLHKSSGSSPPTRM